MLVIDDNMLKLAKMQETLLKVAVDNRQVNLEKYKNIVIEIDKEAFSSLLDEVEQVHEHNRTLENELEFMELIKAYYNQLYEQQLNFKRVCELYGDSELKLSDLSQIDIDYIEKRINTINGYLINLKNIENNKKRLEVLNENLVIEEKNNALLSKRLLEFENSLRENFLNAEGRIIVDGQLQYISVVSEYKKLGYDFKELLEDIEKLNDLLSSVDTERVEMEEKMKTAEICYNNVPNSNTKQILDEISKEFFRVRYRLVLLKILKLLSVNYDDYELFREKREKLLDLIKYRGICLGNLGERISIDPFARTKVKEQFDVVQSLTNNSKVINKIKKEIAELSERVDVMIHQNEDYKIKLNDTKEILISTVGLSDIDISSVTLDMTENVVLEEKEILDNQVVSVGNVPIQFNMSIVKQKTSSVIKRVNEMVSNASIEDEEKIVSPELVIVSQPMVTNEEVVSLDNDSDISYDDLSVLDIQMVPEEELKEDEESLEEEVVFDIYDSSIFETVDPFIETPLFVDKVEEDLPKVEIHDAGEVIDFVNKKNTDELELKFDEVEKKEESDLVLEYNEEEEMPDAFWVTQEDEKIEEEFDDVVLSFDEQINALLADEENTKIKKLVA